MKKKNSVQPGRRLLIHLNPTVAKKMKQATLRSLAPPLLLMSLIAYFCFAGGRLKSAQARLVELPSSSGDIRSATLPNKPYSVKFGYRLLGRAKNLDPAKERQCYKNMPPDPVGRIQFNNRNTIHPLFSVREIDPVTLSQFDSERIILRH